MTEPAKKKLGEILLEHGAIDTYQLSAALAHQRQWGGKIGRVLVELKFASEESICDALALQLGLPSVRILPGSLDLALLATLPQELLVKNYVVPLGLVGEGTHERLRVAMSDPTNMAVLDELRFRSGKRVEVACAPESQIEAALRMEFSGEISLPEPEVPSEAHFAGREIDLDPGDGGNMSSFFGAKEPAAAPVDVLGDGFLSDLGLETPPLVLSRTGEGLTPGPAVLGTLLEETPWIAAAPPPRVAPALDWEAPPIPPIPPPVSRPPPPKPPPPTNGVAQPVPIAVVAEPPAQIAPPPPRPVPPRPPPPPRRPPVAPAPPPVAAGPGPEEKAAEAERRAEEAARTIEAPSGESLEAEALFRRSVEEQKLAEVGEAAVEKLEALDRPATEAEQAVLQTLEDMALGLEVARPIPPAQMVAALVRLLIRRGIIRDMDIIEELSRK